MMFSNRIKELRIERSLSQRELGKQIGYSNASICEWENEKQHPTAEAIIALANFFEVSADYLLGFDDEFENGPSVKKSDPSSLGERSDEDLLVIKLFRKLDPANKSSFLRMLRGLFPEHSQEINQILKTIK